MVAWLSLFGWGYLGLAFWSSHELPTMALLDAVGSRLGPTIRFSGGMGGLGGGMRSADLQFTGIIGGGYSGPPVQSIQQIAHCLWATLAALLGGTVAIVLFGGRNEHGEELGNQTGAAGRSPWRWLLLRSAVVGMGGCVGVVLLGCFFGTRRRPDSGPARHFFRRAGCLA